jgi:hypothetical protein
MASKIPDKHYTARLSRVGVGPDYADYATADSPSVMRLMLNIIVTLMQALVRKNEQPIFVLHLAIMLLKSINYDQTEYRKWKAKITKNQDEVIDGWTIADDDEPEPEALDPPEPEETGKPGEPKSDAPAEEPAGE